MMVGGTVKAEASLGEVRPFLSVTWNTRFEPIICDATAAERKDLRREVVARDRA